MKLVTITGIDKSGKSTLMDKFNKATNYAYYVTDRDPSTTFHFDRALDRNNIPLDDYDKFMNRFRMVPGLHVCLYCPVQILIQRFQAHNEPTLPGNLTLGDHQMSIINHFLSARFEHSLFLDTSAMIASDCVEQMVHAINSI